MQKEGNNKTRAKTIEKEKQQRKLIKSKVDYLTRSKQLITPQLVSSRKKIAHKLPK